MDVDTPVPQFTVDTESLDFNYVPWLSDERRAQGMEYREMKLITKDNVKELRKEMTEQLESLVKKPSGFNRRSRDTTFKGKTVALFKDEESEQFNESEEMQHFIEEVESTGVLIIDREGYNQNDLKKIRCTDMRNKNATSIVQFGTLLGSSIFVLVRYDCRFAHDDLYKDQVTEAEHDEHYTLSGARIPRKLVELLKEPSVIKVQSNVYDDIKLLEMMLDIKVRSWVDIQNVFIMHQRTKSGSSQAKPGQYE